MISRVVRNGSLQLLRIGLRASGMRLGMQQGRGAQRRSTIASRDTAAEMGEAKTSNTTVDSSAERQGRGVRDVCEARHPETHAKWLMKDMYEERHGHEYDKQCVTRCCSKLVKKIAKDENEPGTTRAIMTTVVEQKQQSGVQVDNHVQITQPCW